MTPNVGFRILVLPTRETQQRMPAARRGESFDPDPEVCLGLFRGVLWSLIFEAVIISGIALCWILTHHKFLAWDFPLSLFW